MQNLAKKFSNRNRQKKFEYFLDYFRPTAQTSILDIGASEKEYQENGNILEKKYPHPERITVLGVDEYKDFIERYPRVKVVKYDGQGKFHFQDNEFDISWSNAVIEHVGNREKQEFFLKEIKRVAKKSFIATPNKYFLFEVHTKVFLLHFLPKRVFDSILVFLGKKWATGDYMNLFCYRDLKHLLDQCGIKEYKAIKTGYLVLSLILW